MEELKKKIFKFGIFGDKVKLLSQSEIENLKECNWVQFFHKDEIKELEKDFEYIPKLVWNFCDDNENIYVKLVYSCLKTIIHPVNFKELGCIKVLDRLIKENDFIKQSDLFLGDNLLNAKKVSYVLKTLRNNDLVRKIVKDGFSYVKMDFDKLFESSTIRNEHPVIPKNYSLQIPIFQEIIKNIYNSETGLCSDDLKTEYGISVKRGFIFLKKIESLYPNEIGCKTVFDGRIRKYLFFKKSFNVDNSIKEKGLITPDNRVEVLKMLMADKKWVYITSKFIEEFKNLLCYKYKPERRTLIATAIKADYKVYNLEGQHSSKTYVIANKSTNLSDIIIKKDSEKVEKENEFSKIIKLKYIKNGNLISQDNLYEIKTSKRAQIICKAIEDQYGYSHFILTDEFINNFTVLMFSKIVPIYSECFIDQLIENVKNLVKNNKITAKDSEINSNVLLHKITLDELLKLSDDRNVLRELNNRYNTKRPVINLLEPFWMDCMDLFVRKSKLDCDITYESQEFDTNEIVKLDNDVFLSYKPTNKTSIKHLVFQLETNDLCVKLKKSYEKQVKKRMKLEKSTLYVPYSERMKLYYASLEVETKKDWYDVIQRHIQGCKFAPKRDLLKFFKHKINFNPTEIKYDNETSKEFIFTKIKYDLYYKNNLDPLEYNSYSNVMIQDVISDLIKARYIKSRDRNPSLMSIRSREKVKNRFKRPVFIDLPSLEIYQERDTIYKMYFNAIFDILSISGTVSMESLVRKCSVLEPFELVHFLRHYEDVFEIEEVEETKHVSIKLEIDPFC